MTENEYYNQISNLLSVSKIKSVYYEELDYQDESEYWNLSEDCHSVDLNVIFEMESGGIVQIKWANDFYCYGIGFDTLKDIVPREGVKLIKVNEGSMWNKLVGLEVKSVDVYWDECEYSSINLLPSTISFNFSSEKSVKISAFEINESGENSYWADHLTVFFSDKKLNEYELTETKKKHKVEL